MKFIKWVRDNFSKGPTNLRAIPGGNFSVPKERVEEFIKSFCKARKKWKEGDEGVTWVWVPPKVDRLPLCVDIDLRYETQREQPLDLFMKFANKCNIGQWAIVMKPRMYEKKPGMWAGGCHIYFAWDEFKMKDLRVEYKKQLRLIKEIFPDQDPKECLDDSVFFAEKRTDHAGMLQAPGKGRQVQHRCVPNG